MVFACGDTICFNSSRLFLCVFLAFSLIQVAAAAGRSKRSPSDFLKSVLGRPAVVKLNSGIEYRGVLACLDGYLNIAMEQTQEYGLDGQLAATYGDVFIR
jgi:U6 snRNA-associated Sm-like protein LSm6